VSELPQFSAENLGPKGTIAKGNAERKEEPQKRPEKCGFFGGVWKSPLEQRVASDSNAEVGDLHSEMTKNWQFETDQSPVFAQE
jgi:hypothetical protein